MTTSARDQQASLVAESFGEVNFGAAVLGDVRRTKRLVRVADATVELGDDFCDETLVRIVRALRSC